MDRLRITSEIIIMFNNLTLFQMRWMVKRRVWQSILKVSWIQPSCSPMHFSNSAGLSMLLTNSINVNIVHFSGFVAEHMNLRYFLTLGMFLSGTFSVLFGLAFYINIHSFAYFVIMQIFAGAFQSSGLKPLQPLTKYFVTSYLLLSRLAGCDNIFGTLVPQRTERICHGCLELK